MKYYAVKLDWDESGNLPWHAIYHEGSCDTYECLGGSHQLQPVWKPPTVQLDTKGKAPDAYYFEGHFAINKRTRELIEPLVANEAEFLTLNIGGSEDLAIIHPLWPVDFDEHADLVLNGGEGGNITRVRKYSFSLDPAEHILPRHLFRLLQAKGSAARNGGSNWSTLIISQALKDILETSEVTGVVFELIHETPS